MNLFPALVAVGLALGVAVVARGKLPETTMASMLVPTAKAGARPAIDRYLLRTPGNLACTVVREKAIDGGAFTLRADLDCERLLPGLSQVRYWRERDDVVVFSRDGTDDLLAFAVADGAGYESFRPASALISLAAAD